MTKKETLHNAADMLSTSLQYTNKMPSFITLFLKTPINTTARGSSAELF